MARIHIKYWFALCLVWLAGCAQLTEPSVVADGQVGRCPAGLEWSDATVSSAIGVTPERLHRLKEVRALDNHAVCTMAEAKLQRSLHRIDNPKPDHPGEWAKFRALQQSDENGVVQPDGLIKAMDVRHAVLQAAGANGVSAPGNAGIASGAWTAIGPGNIGGRTRTILIHPSDYNRIWIGSVSGGIWKTTDAGVSWSPVNDFMSNLSVSSLVMSPTHSNTMYAGTGEGFYNADGVRGAGVFKSTDGGVTWSQLSATNPASNAHWYYVNRLAMHPTDGNTLLAATNDGIYKTTDGGVTWALTASGQYADVRFDPLNGANAMGAKGYYGGYIVYSTNSGTSWSNSGLSAVGRAELAYARVSGVAYASVDQNSGTIYKTVDGGATWTQVSTPAHLSQQGWYDNTIWVDPTNSNHLIVGGLDLYRSTNGGATFAQISLWWDSRSVHADHHAIVSSPGYDGVSNKTVYFGNDGGVFRANDITTVTQTTNWTKLNNGLAITQFYSGAGHTGTNGRIIGGTQDNGSLVYPGSGTTWSAFYGGDGGFSAIDPTDGNYIFGEYVYLRIHRSTNGGATGSVDIISGLTDANNSARANFIAPFAIDPGNPNTMYGGGLSLWRSTNVKAGTPTWSAVVASTGSKISQIHVTTNNSDVVWFGRNDGSVWKSTNATAGSPTWTRVGSATLPARMVTSLLVDKDNTNTVYAGFGGYGNYFSNSLWKTTDGGTTWTNIGSALPASPVRAIQRHPSNALWLYAGTEVGVFTSEDGGATWTTTNDGPANASVETLTWLNSTDLLVATHGRGMFKATSTDTSGFTLTVAKAGTGTGTVVSSPLGISCGSTCFKAFTSGTAVTLTATPTALHTFTGWSGACSGTGTCTVTMSQARSVTANFSAPMNTVTPLNQTNQAGSGGAQTAYSFAVPSGAKNLVVQTAGGTGNVKMYVRAGSAATTAAYDCAATAAGTAQSCAFPTPQVTTYHVLLVANTSYAGLSVTATYDIEATGATLTVVKAGAGSGTVTSSPAGISCGSDCTETYASGTAVTLSASPSSGSIFQGWSGGSCSGAGTCLFTINSAQTVTATFGSAPAPSGRDMTPILMLLLD